MISVGRWIEENISSISTHRPYKKKNVIKSPGLGGWYSDTEGNGELRTENVQRTKYKSRREHQPINVLCSSHGKHYKTKVRFVKFISLAILIYGLSSWLKVKMFKTVDDDKLWWVDGWPSQHRTELQWLLLQNEIMMRIN